MNPKEFQNNEFEDLNTRIVKAEKKNNHQNKMFYDTKSKEYNKGSNIIIQFSGTIILFTFFGYILDTYFVTLPIFFLIFIAIGFIISVYNVWRETSKKLKEIKND